MNNNTFKAVIFWGNQRKLEGVPIIGPLCENSARVVAEELPGPPVLIGGKMVEDTAERIDLYAADSNGRPLAYLSSKIKGYWVANYE
jgi:hypothetical protein